MSQWPLTDLIIDRYVLRLSLSQMRANWQAGKYPNVNPTHAKGYLS